MEELFTIVWATMYSFEGFWEEKQYDKSDKLRELLSELGIKVSILKDGKIRMFTMNEFRPLCQLFNILQYEGKIK